MPNPSGRGWKNVAAAALPVLACFLGGATEKWAEGIVVVFLGLLLLADPPRFSLGPIVNGILLALVLCAAVAFLPAHFFFQPAWRVALVEDFGLKLPGTVTPQPWITLGCFISLLAALSWLYYICAAQLESRDTRQRLRLFAAGIAVLAALCLVLHAAHTALPFWHNQRGFGPFPNRNQTANLFGLAALVVLACASDDLRNGRKRWLAWLIAATLLVAAIVANFSRAGLVILVVGAAFWLAGFALRKGSAARIALGISVLLILLTAVLIFGGQTLERFQLRGDNVGALRADFRWLVFQDALRLMHASPWCGIGLGNFEPVFAIFREASIGNSRALHPESDWLWVSSEMGWLAVVLIIGAAGILLKRALPFGEGKTTPFRLAAWIGAILFALHGAVDVSAHRVGTAFAGIFLLGLALRARDGQRQNSWTPALFRVAGVSFILVGAAWIATTRWEKVIPGGIGVANAKHAAAVANRGRNFRETIALTTRALEWAPLDWQLYFQRALGEVSAGRVAAALDDFRRARFLEPNSYEVPLEEGKVWMASQPTLAITAFREALRRARPNDGGVYSNILAFAPLTNPEINRGLEELATRRPELMVIYFGRLTEKTFPEALRRLLDQDQDLKAMTREGRTKLFSFWEALGDQDELARAVEAHPDWLRDAWPALAKHHAAKQEFRSAFELARRFGAPALPSIANNSSLEELQKKFYAGPNNYEIGFALYSEQMRLGKTDDALETARHLTAQPQSPAYFHFLEAEGWAAKENWERAWKAFEATGTR